MSPLIETVTRDALERRRAGIVASVGMSPEELRSLEETHTLTPEQRDALSALDEIEFLLGDR